MMRGRAVRIGLATLAVALLGACQGGEPPATQAVHTPRLFAGLGGIHHPITTQNELAQRYFDQGMALLFGFNHDGAIDAFREAARLDPKCAICWWGIAFASGPNINAPMGPDAARTAFEAAARAKQLASHASPGERDYIAAIELRYGDDFATSAGPSGAANRVALDRAFADAMRGVAQRNPADLDAAALFAESQLDLSPWSYWQDDGSPREHTREVERTLLGVLAQNPDHTGALHYLIHLYERFEPEKAEAAADRLAVLAPDAGHLVHMPAHIYWRVGRYADSARVNRAAAAADVAYFAWCRTSAGYSVPYYTHNVHFLWASEMAEGRFDSALAASRQVEAMVRADEVKNLPFLEDYMQLPIVTLARFGRWDAVLGEPAPAPGLRFATARWHYARALALSRRGERAQAQVERDALAEIAADPAWSSAYYDPGGGTAAQRLAVALHHLDGEIAAARGDREAAVAELEAAIRAQDAIPYSEPPPFYFPVRQALGATLLAHGRSREAEAVYREDLRQYPKNGWSLLGLSQSLARQGKSAEARYAEQGFRNAWARADTEIRSSRF